MTVKLRMNQTSGMVRGLTAAYKLPQRGIACIAVYIVDIVKDFHIHVTHATDKLMREHAEDGRAFLAPWFETLRWMRQHKAETVKIAAPAMHRPPAIVAYTYDQVMPSFSDTGKFDPQGFAVLARSFVQMNLLPKEPDMSKLYTEKFLPGQS